jgi:arabinogalactan endo-1,4-beta-galactosidase
MLKSGVVAGGATLLLAAPAYGLDDVTFEGDGVDVQQVTLAEKGWHTVQARAERSLPARAALARRCGGREQRTAVPASPERLRITVSAYAHSRRCAVTLRSQGGSASFRDLAVTKGARRLTVRGADVSSLRKSEDLGGIYRDERGRPGDALDILRDHGINWIRLRVWVDSADGYHDTAELLTMARRAKRLGLRTLVDFHFSDFWADPGKQWAPAAWAGKPFDHLRETFANYTRNVVSALAAQGTPPDMVQLGNEINSGMLWDSAATWTGCSTADDGMGGQRTECHTENWDNLAALLTSGYRAVKAASPGTKVMLHLADGGSNGTYQWWFGNVTTRQVPFDVIGASFYGYWHGTLTQLQANLDDVTARYGKDVIVVETAYPFTLGSEDELQDIIHADSQLVPGYPATPAGQADWLRDLATTVRAVDRGLGYFWWEATWTAVPGNGWSPLDPRSGNGWENQALFGYDDRVLPAADELGARPSAAE